MEKEAEVMDMVRQQLRRDPPPSTAALYGRAVRIEPKIRDLSLQQFNAKFPLQVKRRRTLERRERKRSNGAGDGDGRRERSKRRPRERDAAERAERIRAVLIQYARALLGAETNGEVVRLLAEIDLYVDAIADAAVEPRGTAPST